MRGQGYVGQKEEEESHAGGGLGNGKCGHKGKKGKLDFGQFAHCGQSLETSGGRVLSKRSPAKGQRPPTEKMEDCYGHAMVDEKRRRRRSSRSRMSQRILPLEPGRQRGVFMLHPEETAEARRCGAVAEGIHPGRTMELWMLMFVCNDIAPSMRLFGIICIVTLLGNLFWGLMMSEAVPQEPFWAERTVSLFSTHFECVARFPTARLSDLDPVQILR